MAFEGVDQETRAPSSTLGNVTGYAIDPEWGDLNWAKTIDCSSPWVGESMVGGRVLIQRTTARQSCQPVVLRSGSK